MQPWTKGMNANAIRLQKPGKSLVTHDGVVVNEQFLRNVESYINEHVTYNDTLISHYLTKDYLPVFIELVRNQLRDVEGK